LVAGRGEGGGVGGYWRRGYVGYRRGEEKEICGGVGGVVGRRRRREED